MTTQIQFIERDGQRQFAVIPIEVFNRLAAFAENAEDIALFDAAIAADGGLRIPSAVANAIINGTHPVKAWREARGFTQDTLAEKAGISKAYLCQIENRKRKGALKSFLAMSKVLDVPFQELIS